MRRRDFIPLIGSVAAWPLAAHAQQPNGVRRVSVLLGIAENDPEAKSRVKAFQQGLRDLGWSEPRNIQIDYRFAASNLDLIKKYVAEMGKHGAGRNRRQQHAGSCSAQTGNKLNSNRFCGAQ